MNKKERICILGGSASGKDYLLKKLIEKGERYSPKLTTRPMRQGETQGVEYQFTNNDEFLELLNNNMDNCLELMGVYMTNLIKERMAQGIKPSNSKITIERKGSSTPLIDSGQLRNSITYRVNND